MCRHDNRDGNHVFIVFIDHFLQQRMLCIRNVGRLGLLGLFARILGLEVAGLGSVTVGLVR